MLILIVTTDRGELLTLTTCIERQNHASITTESAKSALRIIDKEQIGLILLNLNGSSSQAAEFVRTVQLLEKQPPVIVMSQKPNMEDAIEMMKAGAHDFWIKPIEPQRLTKTIDWFVGKYEKQNQCPVSIHPQIITNNPAMLRLKEIARRVASSTATVFIQGESGTGKELFARYLHQHSERRNGPFIALNCAALPESLIESELFGHEKGAFTGAVKAKEGKFELANSGTLFLDEVTEIPVHLQPKLLRVLQENEVDRVGGKYPIPIDVRVVASTNRAIEEAVRGGQFRKDLYYRLNVIPLKLTPLRDRREDIPFLCEHLLQKYNALHKCCITRLSPEAMQTLAEYSWPGNVRELENVVQRAMLLSQNRVISREDLIFDQALQESRADIELMSIDEMEKLMIEKALLNCDGNRTRAAEILGISVRTLRNKLSLYAEQTGQQSP
ncbi:MAG: sigma-54 dependent transcriptional regulator [Desulforhabdus sp.]|nr:sigma-54 dependent transcriptional regulator [Desulforhabdus sp.]